MFSYEKIVLLRIHDHTASIWGIDSLWDSRLGTRLVSACACKLSCWRWTGSFGLVCGELWRASWSAQAQSHLMRLPYTVWLSALLASSLLPLCRPAMWQCVGVAAPRNTDPGLQGQDESLVEDLGLGRPESLLMESWNSLAPGRQPALFPAVWG